MLHALDNSALRLLLGSCCVLAIMPGCASSHAGEELGKVYYLDGAGNWGYGSDEIPVGLEAAGFEGNVENFVWTTSFNPLMDQLNIPAARFRALLLSRRIEDFHRRHPHTPIDVIALSAGTGVATWAIESLEEARIRNFFLLGSSLSHDYDISNALEHINGTIFVYHSPHDAVLKAVVVVGTIDGKRGVEAAGAVGLDTPPGVEDRIVNIAWNDSWTRLGWVGAHTDCTNKDFVEHELARYIVPSTTGHASAHTTEAASTSLIGK